MGFPWLAAATAAAAGAHLFTSHKNRKESKKVRHHAKKESKSHKKHEKHDKHEKHGKHGKSSKQEKKITRAVEKENKRIAAGNKKVSKREEQLFKYGTKQLKKYGNEKFMQKNALNKGQRGLLDFLSKKGKEFKPISDISKNPLYQQGVSNLSDLLSQTPEAYEKFKKPMMEEFNREIAPSIADRFSLYGGQRSSSFQNSLSDAAGQLGHKLGALKAQLGLSALDKVLPFAQAPITNELAQNEQTLASGQLALGTNPYVNIFRPATFGLSGGAGSYGQYLTPSMGGGGAGGGIYGGGGGGGGAVPAKQPGFWSSLLQSAAPGLLQAAGKPIGKEIAGGLGNLFSGWGSSTANPGAANLADIGGSAASGKFFF